MPIQIDSPSDVGATTEWGLYGSGGTPASAMAAVAANDGDASVIYAASGGRTVTQLFQFPPLVGVTDPVTAASITAITREYLKGGGGRSYYMLWNSVQVGSNRQQEVHLATPAYVTVTYSAAAGGLALSAVNGEHGMNFSAAGGPSNKAEYWVTQVYRTVEYTAAITAVGDFAFLIGSWAGAVIGSGLLMREMPTLARYIYEKSRILILPSEYDRALREWQEA